MSATSSKNYISQDKGDYNKPFSQLTIYQEAGKSWKRLLSSI